MVGWLELREPNLNAVANVRFILLAGYVIRIPPAHVIHYNRCVSVTHHHVSFSLTDLQLKQPRAITQCVAH